MATSKIMLTTVSRVDNLTGRVVRLEEAVFSRPLVAPQPEIVADKPIVPAKVEKPKADPNTVIVHATIGRGAHPKVWHTGGCILSPSKALLDFLKTFGGRQVALTLATLLDLQSK